MNRPLGISIICFLGWLGVLAGIISELSILLLNILSNPIGQMLINAYPIKGTMLNFFILVALLLSIAQFVVIYWLWKMQRKGWLWTIILGFIYIILSIVESSFLGLSLLSSIYPILLQVIIMIYLWMKKDLFK